MRGCLGEVLLLALTGVSGALAGTFSTAPWNNDTNAGVSSNDTYTCAVNLEYATSIRLNGVLFTGVTNLNTSGTNFAIGGMANRYTADEANTVTGWSRELAKRFHYGGNPARVTLSGLTPGRAYVATFYSVAWETAAVSRNVTFSCGDDTLLVNQDEFEDNNGIRILYEYVAGTNGAATISVAASTDAAPRTFHLYGFSNREAGRAFNLDNARFEWPKIVGNAGAWEYRADLPGWMVSAAGRVGLTTNALPWAGAGSGAPPAGRQTAFIQYNGGTALLSQQVTNLVAGSRYRLSYRYAARNDATGRADPQMRVSVDGTVVQETLYGKSLYGAANPYYLGAYAFTATGETAFVTFANSRTNGDSAVLLDDVRVEPAAAPGWTLAAWQDDATSGVDGSAGYTHAIDLGSTVSTSVNGVLFKGSGTAGNPSETAAGANYSTLTTSRYANDVNNLSIGADGSAALAREFCYYSATPVGATNGFTLAGLIPGLTYDSTLFGVAFDNDPSARLLAFSVNGSEPVTFCENLRGNDNGSRWTYRTVAPTNGVIAWRARVHVFNYSFHCHAFCNRLASDETLVIADGFAGLNGAHNGLRIDARAADQVNRPGTAAYVETGMNNAHHVDLVGGRARLGANAGAGLDISRASPVHRKPRAARVRADLSMGTLTGTDFLHARGIGLGFFTSGSYANGALEVAAGFTGLVLAPDGGLYLVERGVDQGGASRIVYGGTFDPNGTYTLQYDVDFRAGTLTNIVLQGSAADYAPLAAQATAFTAEETALAGFLGSSATAGTYGYLDNYVLTELIPGPPWQGTVLLIR